MLRTYVSALAETEVPKSFATWSGLAALSAAMGRKVWMNMDAYRVYPNMFIVLVAGSGICRKSSSIGFAEKLLSFPNGPIILSQRLTAEALIEAVSENSDCVIINDELSTFMNRKSYEMGLASVLIPLYDCKDMWSYRTRKKGIEIISNCCLNCLFGTTMFSLRECIPYEAVGEGLTSRILFVYESERITPKPFPKVNMSLFTQAMEMLTHLEYGEMVMSADASQEFGRLYNEWFEKSRLFLSNYLSGYASRRHVHLLKLAMCLAKSDDPKTKVVSKDHIERALLLLQQMEINLPALTEIITSNEKGAIAGMIMSVIRSVKRIDRASLLAMFTNRLDHREFDDVITTLVTAKKLLTIQAQDICYEIHPEYEKRLLQGRIA